MLNLTTLARMIEKRGLKNGWIAKKLGISGPSFYSRMAGKTKFTANEFIQLCEVMQLTDSERLKLMKG